MRLGLYAYLPAWSVDLARRREPADLVLIRRRVAQREVVHACCRRAGALGVRPGMTLAHARALTGPDVLVCAHDPVREQRALRALALRMMRLVPSVMVDLPDALCMDASGCERIYGGPEAIARRVHKTLRDLRLSARVALAPSLAGARALARFGEDEITVASRADLCARIRALPVDALDIDEDACASLREMGLVRISQVEDLPRASLVSRFGDDLVLSLDRMMGRAIEAITPLREEDPLRVQRGFDGPVDHTDAIVRTIDAMLADLLARLARRERGVCMLALDLGRADMPPARVSVRLGAPSRDHAHLMRLLGLRLERVRLGLGVETLCLHAVRTAPLPHRQARAWEHAGGHSSEAAHLGDTLIARLGARRVRRVLWRDGRSPDRIFTNAPAYVEPSAPAPPGSAPTDRPSIVFARPICCDVVLLSPSGPLLRVRWRGASREVLSCLGPERISPHWWEGDEEECDCYRVQLDDGTWLWLWRVQERWLARGEWA